MNKKVFKIISVTIPICALLILVIYKHMILYSGKDFTLKIEGFDPRDLLSGHYLIYQIDYDIDGLCKESKNVSYVCLSAERRWFQYKPSMYQCEYYIKGECKYGNFTAGIEKFFIPQEHAKFLDKSVRSKKGKLIISVNKRGGVAIKNLLIEDKDWKSVIKRNKTDKPRI